MSGAFSVSQRCLGSDTQLALGGLVPWSATDFPGRLSAVVFCQGCPWHCDYCHNPHLLKRTPGARSWVSVCAFLKRRQGLLDGVVFSGGEATLQRGLLAALHDVRTLGFETGLHTAGAYPSRLRTLLPDLDWVGMDVKAPFSSYASITGIAESGARARESVRVLVESGIDFECRTTVHPRLTSDDAITQIVDELADLGVKRYALQEFRPIGCADPGLAAATPIWSWDPALIHMLKHRFPDLMIRRTG